jgi:DedD protein
MDRRVKERLIGASILVALVVLVVPELLSGPKPNTAPSPTLPAAAPEPIRNVTVDLTTSKAPANSEVEPGSPEAGASSSAEPSGASAGTSPGATTGATTGGSTGGSTAASTAASAAYSPAAETPIAPSPAPAGTGASPSAHNGAPAKQPPRTAAARVESAATSPTSVGHGSWSVQLGSFASRANADNLTRQIKGQGFSAFVLTGGSGTSMRYRVRVGPLADRESAERIASKLKSLGHVGSLVAPAA